MIEQAERVGELDELARLFRDLQAELHAARAFVPLWREHNVAVVRSGVDGFRLARDGNYDALARVEIRPTPAGPPP
jgi:peptide/nickel transport system substrate-binding protein